MLSASGNRARVSSSPRRCVLLQSAGAGPVRAGSRPGADAGALLRRRPPLRPPPRQPHAAAAARAVPGRRQDRLREPAGHRAEVLPTARLPPPRCRRRPPTSRPKPATAPRRCRPTRRSCRRSGSVMTDAARAQLEKDIAQSAARQRSLRAGRAGRAQRSAAAAAERSFRRSCFRFSRTCARRRSSG